MVMQQHRSPIHVSVAAPTTTNNSFADGKVLSVMGRTAADGRIEAHLSGMGNGKELFGRFDHPTLPVLGISCRGRDSFVELVEEVQGLGHGRVVRVGTA